MFFSHGGIRSSRTVSSRAAAVSSSQATAGSQQSANGTVAAVSGLVGNAWLKVTTTGLVIVVSDGYGSANLHTSGAARDVDVLAIVDRSRTTHIVDRSRTVTIREARGRTIQIIDRSS